MREGKPEERGGKARWWRERRQKGLGYEQTNLVKICLPCSKTLFHGMRMAALPTAKLRMTARVSLCQCWRLWLPLKVTTCWVGGTHHDFLCTRGAGHVTLFRFWCDSPRFSHHWWALSRPLHTWLKGKPIIISATSAKHYIWFCSNSEVK